MDDILTPQEAALMIGISRRTILHHLQVGNMKGIETVRGYRVNSSEVERLMANRPTKGWQKGNKRKVVPSEDETT